jgi:hypothetical protein
VTSTTPSSSVGGAAPDLGGQLADHTVERPRVDAAALSDIVTAAAATTELASRVTYQLAGEQTALAGNIVDGDDHDRATVRDRTDSDDRRPRRIESAPDL